MGLPYALSSDLVSAWPAKSLEVAQYVDGLVPLLAMTQNAQTGLTYSFLLTDFTKLVTLSNASAVAVTLPLESSVAWPSGTQLRLLNIGTGTVTVAGAVGVTINGSPLTLGQYKGANLIKTGTNTWVFIPFASGVGAAVYSDANTGTYTGFAYKTFTASGTITVTTAGFADIVVCGGGGGGGSYLGSGGGGAGGVLAASLCYLEVGTHTVTIGAGAPAAVGNAAGMSGASSRLHVFYAVGGGGGAGRAGFFARAYTGGSGGGGSGEASEPNSPMAPGTGLTGQGNNGGNGTAADFGGGGGGGAGGVGGNSSGLNGGAGGTGTTTSIAGTTPSSTYVAGSYALGGGGGGHGNSSSGSASDGGGAGATGTGTNGTANKGGGGGAENGQGGSGIVIVRVAV
jgi:hypothetical protein